jgi:transcriptional regulator with XRE-family HTH domain
MREVAVRARESSIGTSARKLRAAQHLTQQELAEAVGVSQKEVYLFEHNLPVPLDIKRRVLKELWDRKANNNHH